MLFSIAQFLARKSTQPVIIPDLHDEFGFQENDKPPNLDAAPVHIVGDACRIGTKEGVVLIETGNAEAREIPIEHVSALHIHGWSHITNGAMVALGRAGIPVSWRSPSGYPITQTQSFNQNGLEARRAQHRIADRPAAALRIARAFVSAKIMNQKGVLRRRLNAGAKEDCTRLRRLALKANGANGIASLLGFEGAAAAIYFGRWTDLLGSRMAEDAVFIRSRRPPADVPNASLSYLYAVLLSEAVCSLSAVGLDPALGFLHQPRAGRPALALDFIEPFRPLIVDTCVLTALNRGQIKSAQTESRFLDPDHKRTLLALFEDRLSTVWRAENEPTGFTWRERLHRAAADLAARIVRNEPINAVVRS